MTKIPLIAVVGATASGKTGLAIDIANKFGGEIVSADSMQIYKYMDIGTAKPTLEEQRAAVHHLIDFVPPAESYSVADYCADAHEVIAGIISRGHIPVICGGTGLYVDSLIKDIPFGEMKSDGALRAALWDIAKKDGGDKLLKMLYEFDPESAAKIHPNNIKRIIRAIEFYKLSGVPISKHNEETKKHQSRYEACMLMIDYPREALYDRINRRVGMMMDSGLLDEVRSLVKMGCTRDMQSMQGIGYKEIMGYLDGEYSLFEAEEKIRQASRNYAKRQLTWFGRNGKIIHLNAEDGIKEAAYESVNKFLILG